MPTWESKEAGLARGVLLAESLRVGASLDELELTVTKLSREDAGDLSAGQPRTWTFVHFSVAETRAEALASLLVEALDEGGWYCDFRTADETFVVFAGRKFRYPRGDRRGRKEAAEYARSVGVPEGQIDWPE